MREVWQTPMNTRRTTVLDALTESNSFRSAQDIYAELRSAGAKIGLTTVYRALQALSDAGEVDVLRTADGESVYRACRTGEHHHHLVCRKCGRTVEVAGPAVERWAAAVGEDLAAQIDPEFAFGKDAPLAAAT